MVVVTAPAPAQEPRRSRLAAPRPGRPGRIIEAVRVKKYRVKASQQPKHRKAATVESAGGVPVVPAVVAPPADVPRFVCGHAKTDANLYLDTKCLACWRAAMASMRE